MVKNCPSSGRLRRHWKSTWVASYHGPLQNFHMDLSSLSLLRNSPTSLTCGVSESCYGKSTHTDEYLTPEWYERGDNAACWCSIHLNFSPFLTFSHSSSACEWHNATCREGLPDGLPWWLSRLHIPSHAWMLGCRTQQPAQLHPHHEVTGLSSLSHVTITWLSPTISWGHLYSCFVSFVCLFVPVVG